MIADHLLKRIKVLHVLLFFTLISILFSSCGHTETPEYVSEKELTAVEKKQMQRDALKKFFDEGIPFKDSVHIATYSYLQEFYRERDYELFWSDADDTLHKASLLAGTLDSAWSYGLNPEWYHRSLILSIIDTCSKKDNYVEKSRLLATTDLLLSNAYFLYITDLSAGFIDTASMDIAWKIDSMQLDLKKYLTESPDSSFTERIFAFQPVIGEYVLLQKALSRWWRENELWTDHFEISDYKKDSSGFMNDARKVFLKMNLIDSSSLDNDSLVLEAMKKFQEMHAIDIDGKPGRQSFASLQKSNYDRFLQAALAMEKLRWKKRTKEFQLYVNIASYKLTVLRNDSALYTFRLVTGAPDHKTPEFKAKLKYISLHPYWHLPHSISTKEFLPLARRDTNYVLKNNYRVFDLNKNPVDLSSINWNKLSTDYFPYRVRQEGGYGNSLGLIVFYFPNKYDVYMHDTPAKYLFARSVRAFSHGCMRLQDPFRLGEIILKEDQPKEELTADSLKARALQGFEQRINLKKHIPIEIDYITTTADSAENIYFHLDIYNRDEKYLEIIRRK